MTRRLPNLNAVKAFDAAARHQSFTLAADELSVTHAAVSRHVRGLERELGVALFERHHRKVLLTEAGARYARTVEQALGAIAVDTGAIRSRHEASRVVIEVESDLAAMWLMPRLDPSPFAADGIELDIRAQSGVAKAVQVGADLALTWGVMESPGFSSEPFLGYTAFPVCAPGWLAARERSGRDDLAGLLPCRLIHERGSFWWDEMFAAARIPAADAAACDNVYFNRTYLSIDAAVRGLGLAVGDDLTCADLLRAGRLVRPCGPDVAGTALYSLMAPRKRPLPAATRRVRDWLLQQAERHRNWTADLARKH